MEWTKAEIADGLATPRQGARRRQDQRGAQPEGQAHRIEAVERVKQEVAEQLLAEFPDNGKDMHTLLGDVEYNSCASQVLDTGYRVDGRKPNEVRADHDRHRAAAARARLRAVHARSDAGAGRRPRSAPRTTCSGSTRSTSRSETTKSFMLHYNFPPFSTGEVRPMRGTSRREIGHGNLAERALQGVLPAFEEFPYTIRIVSDVLESNGSSSMASVCGGSLALFDAGVPIRAAVAGVAMGLIKEGKKYAILTDILGTEDHLGDMDFKVAGTTNGITSIQMDIKIEGLDLKIMKEALAQAKEGRLHILGEMDKALAAPRADLSPYAPRIVTMKISPEKIGDLIGPKGKTIRGIQDETGAELTVDDTGFVTIAAVGGEAMERARQMVQALTAEPVVGETYEGTVKTTTPFGAFVEIMPGTEGLVHISEMRHEPHREDRGRGQEGRSREGEAHRSRRARASASVDEGARCRSPEGMPGAGAAVAATAASGDGERPRREGGDRRRAVASGRAAVAAESARAASERRASGTASRADAALRRTVLPNGLTVLSEHMPGVRSVSFGAWVRAASLHEPRERMGVSHLLEHMVFKGTRAPHARTRSRCRSRRSAARSTPTRRASTPSYQGAGARRASAAGRRRHRRHRVSPDASRHRPRARAKGGARGDRDGRGHARRSRVRAA